MVAAPVAAGLLAGALLLPAGAARAAGPAVPAAPGASAVPGAPGAPVASGASGAPGTQGTPGDALPGVTQLRRDPAGRPAGCLPPSARGTRLTPWPQTFLRPDRVWPLTQGDGVTVAVLGSGVTDGPGLLAGRLGYAGRLPGGGDPARDCVGHGTFLTGLIAADRRAGTGFSGLAPHARILAVGVTDDTGATTADLLAQGITAAAERGARVIDVGVTLPAGSDALAAAVRQARGRGALVVAPAAPDAPPADQDGTAKPEPVFPAAYPEVLAVRDLAPGGAPPEDGTAVGGRVDLAAPGAAVMSTGPAAGGYYTATGSSYATAFVAGTAALVLGYRPTLTVNQLVDRLETTAYRPVGTVPDPQLGHGTVDPVSAVTALLAEDRPVPSPTAASVPAVPAARPVSAAPRQAVLVALGALAVTALVALAAVVGSRGRARDWTPATRRTPEAPASPRP
ncbi:S8 family serine peptidase [Kitasatospora sp. NPDC127111]|uniref:S8 family serine peptidase n=1 Tax=Kitasatospora sp. NPDC127111 TaxID=3345363 RepID=UPI00363DC979